MLGVIARRYSGGLPGAVVTIALFVCPFVPMILSPGAPSLQAAVFVPPSFQAANRRASSYAELQEYTSPPVQYLPVP